MIKKFGYVCLAVGFLTGAFITTRHKDKVEWPAFGACAAIMFAGLVSVRSAARADHDDHEVHHGSIETLTKALTSIVGKLSAMNRDRDSIDVYDVHGRIDADFMTDLGDFVDARESMIPIFGLSAYADIMNAFATGERNINRAWSASADGYIDEVWASLARAEARMREAATRLDEERATVSRSADGDDRERSLRSEGSRRPDA